MYQIVDDNRQVITKLKLAFILILIHQIKLSAGQTYQDVNYFNEDTNPPQAPNVAHHSPSAASGSTFNSNFNVNPFQTVARSLNQPMAGTSGSSSVGTSNIEIIEPTQVDPSTIAPCRMNNHSRELECFGPEVNDTALENVFRSIEAKGVFRGLKLYKTAVTFLDKQVFFEFASQNIDIDGNHNLTLNRIHRITFVRSKEVLRQFKYAGILYSNWVQKQPNDGAIFELVDGFQQLELFSVTDTKIPKIQRSAFGRCELSQLRTINLARNEIHQVGDYAFYRVPNITCIILKENFIKEISNSTFAFEKTSDQLLTIDLSTNLLRSESIQVDAFTRLNRPVVLNLHYNLLTYLDEQTFRPLLDDERSSLIVTSNQIACDCRMKWLLSDSHNYIDRVHGLVCGGHEQQGTELWYFTTYFLESVCNESMALEQPVSMASGRAALCSHINSYLILCTLTSILFVYSLFVY